MVKTPAQVVHRSIVTIARQHLTPECSGVHLKLTRQRREKAAKGVGLQRTTRADLGASIVNSSALRALRD
jgi:hypothetical protein